MEPMLATTAEVLPREDGWLFEFKWDGVRALCDLSAHGVRLSSRRGNDVSSAYPELAALAAGDALVDGEVVAFVDGRPSFGALQERMHVRDRAEARRLAESTPVTYVAFDLLRLEGADLLDRPLAERRELLERWSDSAAVTISPSFDDGAAVEQVAKASGLEGVMAKRLVSRYRPGVRSTDWRKLRFLRTGDYVVVGWEGAREYPDTLSSLVLATVTGAGLRFAGKVGSGLTGRAAALLQRRLVTRGVPPLDDPPPPSPGGRVLHWVEPQVVVEVKYTLVTADGRLRQPVFLRLREDKTVDEANG